MAQFTITNIADVLGVSIRTIETKISNGNLKTTTDERGRTVVDSSQLETTEPFNAMATNLWEKEWSVKPNRQYNSIELFAGAGGLAIGMEKAGFHHVLLNEIDKYACQTLRYNRPNWNVVENDVHNVSFKEYRGKIDLLTGGFPCQAFSYAGNKGGFADTRGTLFFELARAVDEIQPAVFVGENVRGLFTHDNGKTLEVIRNTIKELGYTLVEPHVLKAILYQVPQKRERLFLIAIRNDLASKASFVWPAPYHRIMTLRDAFYKGELFETDVPSPMGRFILSAKRRLWIWFPWGETGMTFL